MLLMRKLTAGLFHSVDGVVEAPNVWQGESFDDDLGHLLGGTLSKTDTALMGRVGWQAWAKDFGEGPGDPYFSPFINAVPKHVASRTLKGPLSWQNSTLIIGDLGDFVRDLKSKPG